MTPEQEMHYHTVRLEELQPELNRMHAKLMEIPLTLEIEDMVALRNLVLDAAVQITFLAHAAEKRRNQSRFAKIFEK